MAPFAALDDRGTYLVERHALSLSPSLATLRIASDRLAALASVASVHARAGGGSRSRVLIAADPAIDRSIYPDLPVLRAAREEADGIAALYESAATVLRGPDVTKAKLIAGLEDADMLHFAGHAFSGSLRPDDAFLVVAGSADPGRTTRLEAAEIARLRLARFRMVLLSACHTAAGRAMRGEGMLNLARPFLAAGAPTVVATLAAVDDYTARDMMLAFHRRLRAGDAPDIALQRVQIERLRAARAHTAPSASSPPSTAPTTLAWADFVVVGAAHQPHRP
jgi:CHAT domain-containing protein